MNSYTKKKIISAVAPVLSGLGIHKLFAPGYAGLGQILTFHRVRPDQDEERIHNHLSLEISPQQLEATIHFYKKEGYAFLSLDEVFEALKKGNAKTKFVAFTFDDGYLDNYTVAYPILRAHNIPFTIYITTNFPDYRAILWWYILEKAVIEKDVIEFTFGPSGDYRFSCKNRTEKEATFDAIRSLINQSFQINDHKELLKNIFDKTEDQLYDYSKGLVLSWDDIRTLNADPLCTIGAHTVNHFPLSQLSEKQLQDEIEISRQLIEEQIATSVQHFAYPFGKVSEASWREFEMVKKLGFKTGVTTRIGNVFPAHQHQTACLPRISVNRVTTKDVLYLQSSGMLPFIVHRGKKVITH